MVRRRDECGICEVINSPDNDDVTLISGDIVTNWRLALMENQGALGAMYITAREHRSDLDSLTKGEMDELMEVTHAMTKAIKISFGATHINFACDMNDAAAREQPTHVHFKLRGRYDHPVIVDDELFEDPGFGTKHIEPHHVGRQTLYVIRDMIEGAYYGN